MPWMFERIAVRLAGFLRVLNSKELSRMAEVTMSCMECLRL